MKKTLLFMMPFLLFSVSSLAGTNPTSLTAKIYKAYMSANADCSSPVAILDAETDPVNYPDGYASVEFVSNPTIGTGSLEDGTYNCVIFKISDHFTVVPEADEGASCVAGTSYIYDTCYGGIPDTTQNAETGAVVTCNYTYGVEDTVWVYMSTYSALSTSSGCAVEDDCNGQIPPTAANSNHGFKLNGQIEVSSDIIGTLVYNLQGKVVSDTAQGTPRCASEPPEVSFRTTTN